MDPNSLPNPTGGWSYFLFLALFLTAIGLFAWRIRGKWLLLRRAAPENRFGDWGLRLRKTLTYAFGQKRIFADAGTGLMHALIFWGFCILGLHTASLFLGALVPGLEFERSLGAWYAWPKDLFVVLVLLAVIWAAFRRAVLRPARVDGSGEAYLVLGLIAVLMVTDIGLEASLQASGTVTHGFLGAWAGPFLSGKTPAALAALYVACFWTQALTILAFLKFLPPEAQCEVLRRRLAFLEGGRSFFQTGGKPVHLADENDPFRKGMLHIARETSRVEKDWLLETIAALERPLLP